MPTTPTIRQFPDFAQNDPAHRSLGSWEGSRRWRLSRARSCFLWHRHLHIIQVLYRRPRSVAFKPIHNMCHVAPVSGGRLDVQCLCRSVCRTSRGCSNQVRCIIPLPRVPGLTLGLSLSSTSKNKFVHLALQKTLALALEAKGKESLDDVLSTGLDIAILGGNDFYSQRAKVRDYHPVSTRRRQYVLTRFVNS